MGAFRRSIAIQAIAGPTSPNTAFRPKGALFPAMLACAGIAGRGVIALHYGKRRAHRVKVGPVLVCAILEPGFQIIGILARGFHQSGEMIRAHGDKLAGRVFGVRLALPFPILRAIIGAWFALVPGIVTPAMGAKRGVRWHLG